MHYPRICPDRLRKTTEGSVSIVSVPAEIRTARPQQDTSQLPHYTSICMIHIIVSVRIFYLGLYST
jgi:hypothetical protein